MKKLSSPFIISPKAFLFALLFVLMSGLQLRAQTRPDPPTMVRAFPFGSSFDPESELHIYWRVAGDGGSPITNHLFQIGITPDFSSTIGRRAQEFRSDQVTTYPDGTLGWKAPRIVPVAGEFIYVRVALKNAEGTSEYSEVLKIFNNVPPLKPLVTLFPGSTHFKVQWKILYDGGSPIKRHLISVWDDHQVNTANPITLSPDAVTYEADGKLSYIVSQQQEGESLEPNTPYYFALKSQVEGDVAVDNTGKDYTKIGSLETLDYSTPYKPYKLKASPMSSSEITLSWKVLDNGGHNITAYHLKQATTSAGLAGATEEMISVAGSGDSFNYTATGLDEGAEYFFQLAATNQLGQGEYSSEVSATTDMASVSIPSAPTLRASADNSEEITLSWEITNNGGHVIEYRLKQAKTSADLVDATGKKVAVEDVTESAGSFSYTIPRLDFFTEYHFQLAAVNNAGSSSYSSEVSAMTELPSVPSAPTIETVAGNLAPNVIPFEPVLYLDWETTGDGGASIREFHIKYAKTSEAVAEATPEIVLVSTLERLEYYLFDVEWSTEYDIQVAAVSNAGQSEYSEIVSVTTFPDSNPPDTGGGDTGGGDGGGGDTGGGDTGGGDGGGGDTGGGDGGGGDTGGGDGGGGDTGGTPPDSDPPLSAEADAESLLPHLYPNPASGTLRLAGLEAMKRYSYSVYNLVGKTLRQGVLQGDQAVDVSALAAGSYVFLLQSAGAEVLRSRVIIRK